MSTRDGLGLAGPCPCDHCIDFWGLFGYLLSLSCGCPASTLLRPCVALCCGAVLPGVHGSEWPCSHATQGLFFTAGKKQGQTGGALFPGVWFCVFFEALNTAQNFRVTAGAWNPGCARGEPKIQNGKRKSRGIAGSLGRDFSVREFPVCCPGTMPRSLFFSGRPFLCARPSP